LFVGDTLYPFTAIHVDCLGSNFNDYSNTIIKLKNLVDKIKSEQIYEDNLPLTVNSVVSNEQNNTGTEETVGSRENLVNFCEILGLNSTNIVRTFNFDSLFQMCDGSVENAINFYLSNMDSLGMLFPPKPGNEQPRGNQNTNSPYDQPFIYSTDINLSCGHVESNLPSTELDKINYTLTLIRNGMLQPNSIDQGYGEYTNDNFTIIVPMKRN